MEYKEYKGIYDGLRRADDVERYISEGYDRRMIETLYTQKVNRTVKKRYHIVKNRAPKLLNDWKRGMGFCDIAERNEFPPVLTAMMIFFEFGTPRKTFWEYVRNPDLLDSPEAAAELREATAKDLVYSPAANDRSTALGKWGEGLLWEWLDAQGVEYMTEADERMQEKYAGEKTPDCLLDTPMNYEGKKVYWIESKASFGDAIEFRCNCRNQLIPYTQLFGPGIVVHWTGYVDGLECPPGIYLEDIGILDKEIGEWRGRGGCPRPVPDSFADSMLDVEGALPAELA
ncbi:C15orf41 family protein [Methanomassiliicoccaceae archaeon COG_1]|nr:C15orf41 family protein [Methanomassiliicoccaceae archaeon COG_1]